MIPAEDDECAVVLAGKELHRIYDFLDESLVAETFFHAQALEKAWETNAGQSRPQLGLEKDDKEDADVGEGAHEPLELLEV